MKRSGTKRKKEEDIQKRIFEKDNRKIRKTNIITNEYINSRKSKDKEITREGIAKDIYINTRGG